MKQLIHLLYLHTLDSKFEMYTKNVLWACALSLKWKEIILVLSFTFYVNSGLDFSQKGIYRINIWYFQNMNLKISKLWSYEATTESDYLTNFKKVESIEWMNRKSLYLTIHFDSVWATYDSGSITMLG